MNTCVLNNGLKFRLFTDWMNAFVEQESSKLSYLETYSPIYIDGN